MSLSASRKASKKIRTVYIEEEEFTIEGDFMNQEIYVYRKPEKYGIEYERYTQENIIEKVLVNKVEPLKEELKTFINCIMTGAEYPVTPGQALRNLRICEEKITIISLTEFSRNKESRLLVFLYHLYFIRKSFYQ